MELGGLLIHSRLKDHFDEPYTEMTSRVSAFNKETQESWAS